jgi:pimeloyl-ACP methyl ester carboxylesterase
MKFKNRIFAILIIVLFSITKANSQVVSEIFQYWTSYSQKINIYEQSGYDFRLTGAIKMENNSKNSSASFWVRVDKKDGKVGFFKNDANSNKLNKNWKTFEIIGKIDENASILNIGTYCENPGDFYFDDVKLEVKKDNEEWKTISLGNSGFEEDLKKEKFWIQGVRKDKIVNVKNFTVEYSNINPYKGNKSMHIKGTNILGNNENGKYIDINGVSLYYEIYGEGEPLLMIHGNGNSMSGFIGQVDEFSKKYKVIFLDCRGRGNSTYNKNVELTFDLQIEDIKLFLEKLNIEKTHIVGWSDGGILGLLMAIKHPEKVNKLVSMAANIFPDGCVDLDDMKKVLDKLIAENKDHKNDLYIDLYNLDLKYPNLEYKDLSVIKSKTLIMAGDHDEIKNEHTVKIFEAIPDAQLSIVPNETHYFPAMNPKLFNQIVLNFLK